MLPRQQLEVLVSWRLFLKLHFCFNLLGALLVGCLYSLNSVEKVNLVRFAWVRSLRVVVPFSFHEFLLNNLLFLVKPDHRFNSLLMNCFQSFSFRYNDVLIFLSVHLRFFLFLNNFSVQPLTSLLGHFNLLVNNIAALFSLYVTPIRIVWVQWHCFCDFKLSII